MPLPSNLPAAAPGMEVTLNRVAADLVGVIQALRLMSDMQRQQGEQLAQVIVLLTPEASGPQVDLGGLLAQLVGVVSAMASEMRAVGNRLEQMTQALPGQLAVAINEALLRAEQRGGRR